MIDRFHVVLSKLESDRRYQYLLLGAITLLAAGLRFYKLGEWSFWFDEVFNTNRALNNYKDLESIIQTTVSHKFLPLSIILSGPVVNALGNSEWNARLVPAIIGIISVPILYFPTRRLFGWGVGLITALLLALSPWHIYWSQNARFYTALLLLYTLALFAFFIAIEYDRPGYILIGFFLLYLATSERFLALWAIPVVASYFLILKLAPYDKPPGFRARNLFLIILLPVIAVGVIEIFSLLTTGSGRFFSRSFFSDFEFFLMYRGDDPFRLLSFTAFNIGFPLMCLGFFSGVYLLTKRNRAGFFFFIAAMVPVILLLLLNPFVFTKDRYVFVSLFGWLILAAVAVKELLAQSQSNTKLLATGVLLLLVADAASTDLLYYNVNNGNRRDWKGAFALIEEQMEDGDVLVSFWPDLAEYYMGQKGISWQDINPDIVVKSDKRYWFAIDSETIWANPEMVSWLGQNGELIDVKYLRTPEDLFLHIYLYDPDQAETSSRFN